MNVISPENKRILLIDEDAALRERSQGTLTRAGYPVPTASNLVEALAHLERRHHDAVILELTREHAHALSALRERAPGTPVLVLASTERLHDALLALREGAEDYVQRPPDPFELRTRLERILERFDLGSRIALLQDEVSCHHGVKHLVAQSGTMKGVLWMMKILLPMMMKDVAIV